MKVTRTYVHRTLGEVGKVDLEAPTKGWTLDGKTLSEDAVEYLMTFALQGLQDAYAGAKDAGEAQGNFAKKRDRIIDGTIGVRTGGTVDPLQSYRRKIVRANLKARKADYDAIPSDDQKARQAFLDECYDGLADKAKAAVDARAQELADEDTARRKRVKELAKTMDL